MPAVFDADRVWNMRVSTGAVNRFLEDALARHPPPAVHGRRVRIRYMTQAKARPPTFALFGNQLKALPESYLRYLVHAMRDAFEMPGTPVRLNLRPAKIRIQSNPPSPHRGRGPGWGSLARPQRRNVTSSAVLVQVGDSISRMSGRQFFRRRQTHRVLAGHCRGAHAGARRTRD